MSVVKRINLILLFLVLSFGIEENYCSDNVGGNENFEGQHVGRMQSKEIISGFLSFFSLFIFPNVAYWFFDWYQKKRGWYFYKYYYCGGYRTRLYHKIFYFDIYLRWFFILRLVCPLISFFVWLLINKSCPPFTDARVYVSAFLCIFPEIDLNIRLGKKFYLVIGFKDIFAMPLYSKFIQLFF